ncbi:MAG: pirin family protein [Bdellovibrionaceae bacterium]|nr:pirin family protein [Pseudobdellovibrionaceae bacterium]
MNNEIPYAIPPRTAHVGGPQIKRVLPWSQKRTVGPFIFLDHFPSTPFAAGDGFNVRSHPHIGLSTLSYLLEGAVLHHDSLGYKQVLRPGDVNWMTAGRGIAHSEKTPEELRDRAYHLHLLQFWVALPVAHEKVEPSFTHHPANTIPEMKIPGAHLRVVAGEFQGTRSPVKAYSPLHFVDVKIEAGGSAPAQVPGHESAFYVLDGEVSFESPRGTITATAGECYFLGETGSTTLKAQAPAHVVLFGGEAFPEERFIEWNFVASSRALIDAAKAAWADGSFPQVPGETDIIPLPR